MARSGLQFNPGGPEAPYHYDSGAALAASGVVVGDGPALLFTLTATNTSASDQYVLVFDAAAVPADGTAAKCVLRISAGATASLDYAVRGKVFRSGICWSNSSSAPLKTIGAANCFVEANWQ